MAEKILNTRIQLKYDSYAEWDKVKDSFTPKKGELCIVELAAPATADQTNAEVQHPILFKVGDGEHTFAQLPWVSALAADVYAWAKQASLPIVRGDAPDKAEGNVISGIKIFYT